MRKLFLLSPTFFLFAACGPTPVDEMLDRDSLVGFYEAQLPSGKVSVLELRSDGTIVGENVPSERVYDRKLIHRSVDSTWKLCEPSASPSPFWCVEFDVQFLRIYQDGDHYILRHPYDVDQNQTAVYEPIAERPR